MKCFLVINQLNNPVFLDFDAEFTKFIKEKALEVGLQNADETYDSSEVDTAVVTQLFSPLVLSQVPLDDQVKNPCTSVICPNGLLLVFRKVDDIQYIAISGDDQDSVDFLQKKILVFIQMTKFLFGPVYMEIANCSASERTARWSFLRGVLHTWTHLATTDHSFLVEASERLHVNQLVTEKCVGLLEKTVNRMQATADQASQHAFLLVNTKLLALYSKRSAFKLQPADILLTTLLTQDMFPSNDSLDDLLSSTQSFPPPPPASSSGQVRRAVSASSGLLDNSGSLLDNGSTQQDTNSTLQDNSGTLQGSLRSQAEGGMQVRQGGGRTHGEGGGNILQSSSRNQGESSGKDRERTSDDNEEFHSAPTTPSQTSPTPDADNDILTSPLAHGVGARLGADGGRGIRKAADADGHRGGKVSGHVWEEEDGDGGLERLIPTQPGGHSGSVSSGGNKGSTTGSSVGDMEFPPLSYQDASGVRPRSSTSLLSGQLSTSDMVPRGRSSTADARQSDSSRKTPSDHSSQTAEAGSTGDVRSRSSTEQSGQGIQTQSSVGNNYWPHIVFLQTRSCPYTPHTIHCAQILPGISLVVVSQVAGHTAADPLCQVLSIVQDLLQGRRNKLSRPQALHVHDVISELLRKVHNVAKKFKRKIHNSSADVVGRWESVEMREKLLIFLLQDEHLPMLPDLESSLMDLHRRLKELFQMLFVASGRLGAGEGEGVGEGGREVMSRMKARLQRELMDYRDYLGVKAQRNITMTSYLDEFPGLVHFIYIDRQFHQMIAPSFNLMSEHGHSSATLFLKEKVWTMYGYMIKKLQQGYTSVLLREGDFYFSFFLWFEDSSGNPVSVQEPYKPGLDTPLPGILTGSFYKRLLRQCFPDRTEGAVNCYEMFLMHVGLVTPPYIAAHCQKLAHKLWQMSGEAYTPINLL